MERPPTLLALDVAADKDEARRFGNPLELVNCLMQPLAMPAETEIVVEGYISVDADETVHEGPFGEFVGYHSGAGPAPVVHITALTHRAALSVARIRSYRPGTVPP